MLWLLLYALRIPLGLDTYVPVPEDNPLRPEVVALGRKLFHEKRLSRDNTISCATCHDPARAFTDQHPRTIGIDNQIGPRRSPRILNRAWGRAFFWDGRAATLEEQVLQPIANPIEMALPVDEAVSRLQAIPDYRGIDKRKLSHALASYVRTILAGNSPYDRFLAGDRTALTPQQQEGLQLFRGKAGCISCHLGPNLTDEDFHNTGAGKTDDKGRDGTFKTPSLRQVAQAATYFHDGSAPTLEAVIDHYDKGKADDPEIGPLKLTPEEKQSLVAFLESLTGEIREGM